MKVILAIKTACDTGNSVLAGRIADFLRIKLKYNYNQVCAAFVEHGKCTADEFESMMQYADYSEHGYI